MLLPTSTAPFVDAEYAAPEVADAPALEVPAVVAVEVWPEVAVFLVETAEGEDGEEEGDFEHELAHPPSGFMTPPDILSGVVLLLVWAAAAAKSSRLSPDALS